MGLGGTGLERRPLRPSDEGCGEMEVMDGATPKGLEEAGVGETPLLEMVLPGVTAMPGTGDDPAGQRSPQSYSDHTLTRLSLTLFSRTFPYSSTFPYSRTFSYAAI